jgi:hypothetical protein
MAITDMSDPNILQRGLVEGVGEGAAVPVAVIQPYQRDVAAEQAGPRRHPRGPVRLLP